MSAPHRLTIRVYYEDTDFSGVVYHASYLRFMERGRTELLRDLGIHQQAIHSGDTDHKPFAFVVRGMNIEFLKAAKMDDVLVVETSAKEVKGASAILVQRVLRGEEVLVTADVRVAAVADGKAARLPVEVREKLAG
ncbi:MAG: tol-pal system-associated acyl-CoA thioesterase [Hyphomicrobiales bacterium]|nr:tol-pal system-associated acyl-CoA thioesterase [Methylobacteriaceae bacterium]MCC2109429.1 tol-pal system-associated acyl-CoA thioesterase [Hyphomicrobiales bacterium]